MTRFEPRNAIVLFLFFAGTIGCVSDDEGRNPSSVTPTPETTPDAAAPDSKPKTKLAVPIQKKPKPNPTIPGASPSQPGASPSEAVAPAMDGGTGPTDRTIPNISPQQYIFNRIIVKLDQENPVERDVLVAAIEKKTGATVEKTLGGPLNTVLIVFAAAIPPRDADAQKMLAKELEGIPEIKSAQADQHMQAR
jgi:hypothetical protein